MSALQDDCEGMKPLREIMSRAQPGVLGLLSEARLRGVNQRKVQVGETRITLYDACEVRAVIEQHLGPEGLFELVGCEVVLRGQYAYLCDLVLETDSNFGLVKRMLREAGVELIQLSPGWPSTYAVRRETAEAALSDLYTSARAVLAISGHLTLLEASENYAIDIGHLEHLCEARLIEYCYAQGDLYVCEKDLRPLLPKFAQPTVLTTSSGEIAYPVCQAAEIFGVRMETLFRSVSLGELDSELIEHNGIAVRCVPRSKLMEWHQEK